MLQHVHAGVAQRGLVEDGQVPDVEVERPQRERDERVREDAQPVEDATPKTRKVRIGAISGPVSPSTISSAPMSPSSRCSTMCT